MANYYNENTIIYLNGAFVKAAEAKMDFYSQSLHYGYSVFEGIRSYKTLMAKPGYSKHRSISSD
jgi:branched-chain amino acid aminotransferase